MENFSSYIIYICKSPWWQKHKSLILFRFNYYKAITDLIEKYQLKGESVRGQNKSPSGHTCRQRAASRARNLHKITESQANRKSRPESTRLYLGARDRACLKEVWKGCGMKTSIKNTDRWTSHSHHFCTGLDCKEGK